MSELVDRIAHKPELNSRSRTGVPKVLRARQTPVGNSRSTIQEESSATCSSVTPRWCRGHTFEIKTNRIIHTEKILCDGRVVSRGQNVIEGHHTFTLEENGEDVTYYIATYDQPFCEPPYVIKRNGVVMASTK